MGKAVFRVGALALRGEDGNEKGIWTTKPTALMKPLIHLKRTLATPSKAVDVPPCTRQNATRRHPACNLQTRSRYPEARPVATRRSVAPFIDIRERKKGYG